MKHRTRNQTLLILVTALGLAGCPGKRPELGVTDGKLSPCPTSPNCVSSQAGDRDHFIPPIVLELPTPQARTLLLHTLDTLPNARTVTTERSYIRVECTSRIFGFIDDLELLFPEEQKTPTVIQVRSAARLGYSDLGVNRKRIERLRTLLEKGSANMVPTQK